MSHLSKQTLERLHKQLQFEKETLPYADGPAYSQAKKRIMQLEERLEELEYTQG